MNLSFMIETKLEGIHCETIPLKERFIELGARFAPHVGTVNLMSGGDTDSARYHIIAAKPWLTMKRFGKQVTLETDSNRICIEANSFDVLKQVLKMCRLVPPTPVEPVSAGLFGYFAYDLKDDLEELPQTTFDDLGLPQMCLYAPSIIIIHDIHLRVTQLCIPKRRVNGVSLWEQDRKAAYHILNSPAETGGFNGDAAGFRSTLTRDEYLQAVVKIKEYIAAGDIYQVNMSQRFETDFQGCPYSLFQSLYNNNPAPFFSFINAGDHHIVSTSPERFIKRDLDRVETRPIKGTRPRGKTDEQDRQMADELAASKKDDAELSMIVDLLRNDLGKVCRGGTVVVTQHKRMEAYKNVFHLVSIVEGRMKKDQDTVDLIQATFPGGSITGCPKIRSMEIIDELEPIKRHVYTGAIGYIGFHDTLDLSIAIRTATLKNNRIYFSVGGGVVYDSDPQDEFEETLHKGQSLLEILKGLNSKKQKESLVWMNGKLIESRQAMIPVTDQGLQYGFGFFETISVRKGVPNYLDAHMERFRNAWRDLFGFEPPTFSWGEIIRQTVTANHLENDVAACKIMATYGSDDTQNYNGAVVVSVRPYIHRLQLLKAKGLKLGTYPHQRQTPLADHKSLNYLYYLLAGKWALKNGFDEALILNPDQSISETNTANILLVKEKRVFQPLSSHFLPGIMAQQVLKYLTDQGYQTHREKLFKADLLNADQVIITNSLMGAVPILRIDEQILPEAQAICDEINRMVFF